MSSHKPSPGAASPLRLTSADFDAFLPDRAPGAARARVELRQRVLAWARGVVARLAELDIAVEADEQPHAEGGEGRAGGGLRIVFQRDADARAQVERALGRSGARMPLGDHVCLALAVERASVAISIELWPEARLDLRNLSARLEGKLSDELSRALEALPEQFAIAPAEAGGEAMQALRAGAEGVGRVLQRSKERGVPLWIGWSIPRDIAVKHSALLDEHLEDAIVALGPVYKLIAWAPDNDLIGLARDGDEGRLERPRGRDADRERAWEGRTTTRDRAKNGRSDARREQSRAKPRATPEEPSRADAARRRDGKRSPSREASPVVAKEARVVGRPLLHTTLRPSLRTPGSHAGKMLKTSRGQAAADVARAKGVLSRTGIPEVDLTAVTLGARVRVLAGPFLGKVGVVQELDGKGSARVMLGLLATRLDVKDLVASSEGRERPALSSSHRKPIPSAR